MVKVGVDAEFWVILYDIDDYEGVVKVKVETWEFIPLANFIVKFDGVDEITSGVSVTPWETIFKLK